jgi:putative molybdopterin biosynthesis protein
VNATLSRKVTSPAGDDDYLRVAVGKVGEKILAAPLSRGSGVITSLVRADGITIIKRGSQGLAAGTEVAVRLYRQPSELERTIFAIGSHDITLDLLSQFLSARNRRLASANVGSLGGIMAIKRGEAHIAGSHLLDPISGEYNFPFIREYLSDVPVRVLHFVGRQQGLIVQKGNPKNILFLQNLLDPTIQYVNRQRGSGTRVLFDYLLEKSGIGMEQIHGYEHEEFTHLSVAALVSSGRADAGLGIAAAAKALDLDFVPLIDEKYELIIPVKYADSELIAPLLDLLNDPTFQKAVQSLPGYDISEMGRLRGELP